MERWEVCVQERLKGRGEFRREYCGIRNLGGRRTDISGEGRIWEEGDGRGVFRRNIQVEGRGYRGWRCEFRSE